MFFQGVQIGILDVDFSWLLSTLSIIRQRGSTAKCFYPNLACSVAHGPIILIVIDCLAIVITLSLGLFQETSRPKS